MSKYPTRRPQIDTSCFGRKRRTRLRKCGSVGQHRWVYQGSPYSPSPHQLAHFPPIAPLFFYTCSIRACAAYPHSSSWQSLSTLQPLCRHLRAQGRTISQVCSLQVPPAYHVSHHPLSRHLSNKWVLNYNADARTSSSHS